LLSLWTKNINLKILRSIDYARNKKRKPRYVSDWIKSLLNENLKPVIEIIEETNELYWANREKYWIRYYRNLNCKLCNLTDGGESNNGYVYSEELKEIRRQARLGWVIPEETKNKISKSLSKKVICVEDDLIYNSMKDAIKSTGISKSTFHRKLHNNQLIKNKTYKYV
tara:strand:- start:107 stop:610 length:504 start_codon:yes stop_codon:yes gene_type:complete